MVNTIGVRDTGIPRAAAHSKKIVLNVKRITPDDPVSFKGRLSVPRT